MTEPQEKSDATKARTTGAEPKPEQPATSEKTATTASPEKAPAKKARVAKKKAPKKPAARKATTKKAASRKASTTKAPARKTTAASAKATKSTARTPAAAASSKPTITQLKETIMATKTTDKNNTMNMTADMQERAQTAFAKVNDFASEAGEFSKGNVEAMVESGKIWFDGAQGLMREEVETGKTVVETMTEDAKKAASVKSPTEFMQMQSEIARRNFDAMVSYGSKRTEAWVKLYNDAFAPLSNRASVATEKLSKVA
ncbi:MAG: TIGR01841 family phasin [Erythrobacter sp.]